MAASSAHRWTAVSGTEERTEATGSPEPGQEGSSSESLPWVSSEGEDVERVRRLKTSSTDVWVGDEADWGNHISAHLRGGRHGRHLPLPSHQIPRNAL